MGHSLLWPNPIADGEEKLTNKVQDLLASSSFRMRPEDGKLYLPVKATTMNTPWIHVGHGTTRHCGIYNKVYTQTFGHIPYFCRFHCWKTVIKPRTVKELFQLHDLMQAMDVPGKCGIDVRDYTPGPYAAFIYGDNLEEGRGYHKMMSDWVHKNINEDIPVILKRGCTEMELLRPSDTWEPYTEEERFLERKLDDIFIKEEIGGQQSRWVKNHVKRMWLRHAMSIGDETWKELTGGDIKGMHPHVVQYQNDDAFNATCSLNCGECKLNHACKDGGPIIIKPAEKEEVTPTEGEDNTNDR